MKYGLHLTESVVFPDFAKGGTLQRADCGLCPSGSRDLRQTLDG
jgi:hypothetical protein